MIDDASFSAAWRTLVIDDQIGSNAAMQQAFAVALGAPLDTFFFTTAQVNGRNSIEEACRVVGSGWPSRDGTRWSLIYLDIRFDQSSPGSDDAAFGFRVLEELRRSMGQEMPVVVLTSEDEAKKTHSNRADATSFLPKPPRWAEDVLANEHRAVRKRHGIYPDESGRCLGSSLAFIQVLRNLRGMALDGEMNVMLLGESGSGKTRIAEFFHQETGRSGEYVPFFADPANPELEGTKLFGFWHGTYSGAPDGNYFGYAEQAHLGTLFIDELAELAPQTQAQLLEYRDPLAERSKYKGWRKINRRGSYEAGEAWARRQRVGKWEDHLNLIGEWDADMRRILVNTVLISATNRRIDDPDVRKQFRFRDDLAFGIAPPHATVYVPALRDRREEIPALFMTLVNARRLASNREPAVLESDAAAALSEYQWPDNFRGLNSAAAGVVASLSTFREITPSRLLPFLKTKSAHASPDPRTPTVALVNTSPAQGPPLARRVDPEYLVGREVELIRLSVDSLRACFEDAVNADPNSPPDLKPVMQRLLGTELRPADSRRELKRILDPIWAATGSKVARKRLRRVLEFRDLVDRCQNDPVLQALHAYATGNGPWNDAATKIAAALKV